MRQLAAVGFRKVLWLNVQMQFFPLQRIVSILFQFFFKSKEHLSKYQFCLFLIWIVILELITTPTVSTYGKETGEEI